MLKYLKKFFFHNQIYAFYINAENQFIGSHNIHTFLVFLYFLFKYFFIESKIGTFQSIWNLLFKECEWIDSLPPDLFFKSIFFIFKILNVFKVLDKWNG